jgi:hypothetical protein
VSAHLLVTGGAGFIGSRFVRDVLAADDGTRITVLDKLTYAGNEANLDPVRADAGQAARLRFVRGDIADAAVVGPLVADADAVVNFAAESHVDRSILDPEAFLRTGVLGVNVLFGPLLLRVHFGHPFDIGGLETPALRDHNRNATTPAPSTPAPNSTTAAPVVAKMNDHPMNAMTAGTGYSHIRYGLGMSGRCILRSTSPAIWPPNCTTMRVAMSASITMPSGKAQQTMEMAPSTRSETCGNCLVACSRPNEPKK